jgi:hypothetical protein
VPKFTCDEDASSVVHVIAADVVVMPDTATPEITGPATVVPGVVKSAGKGQIKPVPGHSGQACD